MVGKKSPVLQLASFPKPVPQALQKHIDIGVHVHVLHSYMLRTHNKTKQKESCAVQNGSNDNGDACSCAFYIVTDLCEYIGV